MSSNLPQGSWTGSARNYYASGGMIFAELRDSRGAWIKASAPLIPGVIYGNKDGAFEVESMPLPGGTWKHSSLNPRIVGNILRARLQTRSGAYVSASVLLDGRATEFENQDGCFVPISNSATSKSVEAPTSPCTAAPYGSPKPQASPQHTHFSGAKFFGGVTKMFNSMNLGHQQEVAPQTVQSQAQAPQYQHVQPQSYTPNYQHIQPQPHVPQYQAHQSYVPQYNSHVQPAKQACFKCQGKGWVHESPMTHKTAPNMKCFFCEDCKGCGGRGHL